MIDTNLRYVIAMLDGFGLDYYEKSYMPRLKKLASENFFKKGKAIFPTLTNANNISIVCGSWPETHGVTTNCYLDEATGDMRYLEDPSFLRSPTLFEVAKSHGLRSALLTGKAKTLGILGGCVDFGVAAQEPDEKIIKRYGSPPDIYSSEVNLWLWKVALDLLENRRDISVIYVHTTDYAMHRWAPEEAESLDHLAAIDSLMGHAADIGSDAIFLVTADHGMNAKKRCLDLHKISQEAGIPVRFSLSPVADRLLKHHSGYGGAAYVYLEEHANRDSVMEFIAGIPGVEECLPRELAAQRYHLMAERIGDIVIAADRETVFGTLDGNSRELPEGYRNHGSHHEDVIPLIAWGPEQVFKGSDEVLYNFDLTRSVFFRAQS